MKVYNKTSRELSFSIKDRYDNNFTVYLKPGRSTELEIGQDTKDVHELLESGSLVLLRSVDTDKAPKVHPQPSIKLVEEEVTKEDTTEDSVDSEEIQEPLENSDEIVDSNSEDTTEEVTDEEIQESDEVLETTEVESQPDVFICKLCGKEYATQRGLTMHTNKEHKE